MPQIEPRPIFNTNKSKEKPVEVVIVQKDDDVEFVDNIRKRSGDDICPVPAKATASERLIALR